MAVIGNLSPNLPADSARKSLKMTPTNQAADVELPAKALDPVATLVVLETKQALFGRL